MKTIIYILLNFFLIYFKKVQWMDHLRQLKYKTKRLENSILELGNNFNPINISINDMDKYEKKN